jgi:hypothetical protein
MVPPPSPPEDGAAPVPSPPEDGVVPVPSPDPAAFEGGVDPSCEPASLEGGIGTSCEPASFEGGITPSCEPEDAPVDESRAPDSPDIEVPVPSVDESACAGQSGLTRTRATPSASTGMTMQIAFTARWLQNDGRFRLRWGRMSVVPKPRGPPP